MTEFEPIDWVEFDDDIDDNEERIKNIIQKYSNKINMLKNTTSVQA